MRYARFTIVPLVVAFVLLLGTLGHTDLKGARTCFAVAAREVQSRADLEDRRLIDCGGRGTTSHGLKPRGRSTSAASSRASRPARNSPAIPSISRRGEWRRSPEPEWRGRVVGARTRPREVAAAPRPRVEGSV